MNQKREEFSQQIAEKLELYYSLQSDGSTKKKSLGDHIDGFVEAGILLRYVTREEFLQIADQLHTSIRGKSLRQQSLDNKIGLTKDRRDWKEYNEPTYIRKKNT